MNEPHVVVVVRVLDERFPIHRVHLVEVTVETLEVLEAVHVVALCQWRDPFAEWDRLMRQASENELVPSNRDTNGDQSIVFHRKAFWIHALLVGNSNEPTVK